MYTSMRTAILSSLLAAGVACGDSQQHTAHQSPSADAGTTVQTPKKPCDPSLEGMLFCDDFPEDFLDSGKWKEPQCIREGKSHVYSGLLDDDATDGACFITSSATYALGTQTLVYETRWKAVGQPLVESTLGSEAVMDRPYSFGFNTDTSPTGYGTRIFDTSGFPCNGFREVEKPQDGGMPARRSDGGTVRVSIQFPSYPDPTIDHTYRLEITRDTVQAFVDGELQGVARNCSFPSSTSFSLGLTCSALFGGAGRPSTKSCVFDYVKLYTQATSSR